MKPIMSQAKAERIVSLRRGTPPVRYYDRPAPRKLKAARFDDVGAIWAVLMIPLAAMLYWYACFVF
jgi:hypothetical protein